MLTINDLEVKEKECALFNIPFNFMDNTYWSKEDILLGDSVTFINHQTRKGTLVKLPSVKALTFSSIVSTGLTMATRDNCNIDKLVEDYPYHDTSFSLFDGVLGCICKPHRLHPGTVFKVEGVELLIFSLTPKGKPIVFQDEVLMEEIINELPGSAIFEGLSRDT